MNEREIVPPAEMSIADGISFATKLHRAGQLEAAELIYRRVLDVLPDHPDAMHFLGVLCHHRGDSHAAVELIRRSIAIDPDLPDRYINLGNVLVELGSLDEAAASYRHAIACGSIAASTCADAWSNLGAVLRAQRRYDEAAAAYETAIECAPEHADAYNNYGNLLSIQGRAREALSCYCKAITIAPRHAQSRTMLGLAYYTLGQINEAVKVYQEWLEEEPDNPIAHHMLAACSGENVPARASNAYIQTTFDTFAQSFDAKLLRLEYRAPQLLTQAVARAMANGRSLHTLDAGCGTGLCGPLLKPCSARLIGVDLSKGMLDRARTLGVYDELVNGELTAYLAEHSTTFDLIVSADTLVYFGPLETALGAAYDALRAGGMLGFSLEAITEHDSASDYRINPHGRYSHRRDYVERVLGAIGYQSASLEEAVLRNEGGVPVAGMVVTCKKAD